MLKKFVKKIGKGIKKIGKAIGKPFKKLMKTKLGKIVGTIGMMMIGGWMMAGAQSFVGSMWAGKGMGTAFSNSISAMGTAARTSYTTITGGIEGMFGKGKVATANAEAVAASTEAGTTNMSNKLIDQIAIDGKVPTSDITTQAMQTTQDRLLEAGTETPSGRVVGLSDDAFSKVMKKSPIGDMPMGLSTEQRLDFASSIAPEVQPTQYIAQKKGVFGLRTDDISMQPLVNDPVTGKAIVPDGFREVSDFGGGKKSLLDKAYDMPFEQIKDKTYGYQPFKDTNLPGVIREGTLGQGYALSQALATPEEQYVQGYSDMSGAYSALDANTARLQSAIPTMDQLQDGRTSVMSPSVVGGAADYMANTRKAGFVWDTSLLAVNPSNFAQ